MSVDTRNKRASCLALDVSWGHIFENPPDGTTGAPIRQQRGYVYAGIAAGGAAFNPATGFPWSLPSDMIRARDEVVSY